MKNTFFKKLCSLSIAMLMISTFSGSALAQDADIVAPSDVDGLEALPGDSSVDLSWEVATDDTAVTGYKIYYGLDSVVEDGGAYTFGAVDAGDVVTYTMAGLENDVTYYFAVTAYDAEGNESEYYSNEASATPVSSESEDLDAPYIVSASATNNMVVEVIFSEDVVLPADAYSVFEIMSLETDEALEILDAYVSEESATTVLLLTATQEEGMSYMITAGTGVSDEAGNAIVSGTSDTAVFDGGAEAVVDEEEEVVEEEEDTTELVEIDETSPEIDDVESASLTEVNVIFDEVVVLPTENPEAAFEIIKGDDDSIVEVTYAAVSEEAPLVVILYTSELEAGEDYIITVTGITDEAGNELTNTFDRTASFKAATYDVADLIAPEDVTDFVAALVAAEEDEDITSVELEWTESENSEGDLDAQLLYISEDDGESYDTLDSLSPDVTSHIVDSLTPGLTYFFKLTMKDLAGNESDGVIRSITLPESGAGLGAVMLATVMGVVAWRRR